MLDVCKMLSESYDEARENFSMPFDEIGLTPKSYANPLTGPNGGTLATDCLWIGPEDAEKVLVCDLPPRIKDFVKTNVRLIGYFMVVQHS